jgi:transcriptional regulator with XRE-family HTH domain
VSHTKRIRTLRDWRSAHKLSTRAAASHLGISQSAYHKYETGQRHPRPAFLKRIIAKTGVSVDVLVGLAS